MLTLTDPESVRRWAYSDSGRKSRADNALAQLRRNADYKKSAIDCAGVETTKRALDTLQAKRVGQEFNERDTLILDWVECVLKERITPVEVVMELPTDNGYLQFDTIFRGIQKYVQDVKLQGEPYERPVEDRSAAEKDEVVDTWYPFHYKAELLRDIVTYLDIMIFMTFVILLSYVDMHPSVIGMGILAVIVTVAILAWPRDRTFDTEPRYKVVEKVKWGQALFFKGAPDAELEFGDSWQNWANKSVEGGSSMIAFTNIAELGNYTYLSFRSRSLMIDLEGLGEDMGIPFYARWMPLNIDEDCSDTFDLVGFYQAEGSDRITFRQIWEAMEEVSQKRIKVIPSKYGESYCDFEVPIPC
jgi:hypothetical protein